MTKSTALSSPAAEVEEPPPPPRRPELFSPGENMPVSATVRIDHTTYDVHDCEGDGNCLPYALNGSNDTLRMILLRDYVAHHVRANADVYNLHGLGDELHDLTTAGAWAGELFLQSFSDAFGHTIIVHHMDGGEPNVFQPSAPFQANATGVVFKVLFNNVHYARLVERQPAEDESSDDEESEDGSFEGEDGSDDEDEDSSSDDDDKDGHFPTIEESPSESGSYTVEEVSSDDEENSEAEDSEDDGSGDEENSEAEDSEDDDSGDEMNSGDEPHPGIDEVLSGSYEGEEAPPMPTPRPADDEPRRGSPLDRLLSSARSAANRMIEGFNASPSSLFRQNLNQRFEDTDQNRRRSTRDRKKITVFDPSSTR